MKRPPKNCQIGHKISLQFTLEYEGKHNPKNREQNLKQQLNNWKRSMGFYDKVDKALKWDKIQVSPDFIEHEKQEACLEVELVFSMKCYFCDHTKVHVTLMPERYNAIISTPGRFVLKHCHFSLLRDSLAVHFSFLNEGHVTTELWVMKDFYRVVEAGEPFSSYSWSHELTVELPNLDPCVSMGFWNKNELLLLRLASASKTYEPAPIEKEKPVWGS
ncbi:hypothetical protein RHMOL_Rhmol12G0043200 [Rhododendron molle]|uniref:Uncharacterized protein n=1 Tax=Rhododendron molle TaxID=49168 RepID=A0ACC0LFU2_RHOML|nr:hypothetical protein RHMOL_Rhmol12G0043200 [Rhododendron molle]